jgi:hypothetical protein
LKIENSYLAKFVSLSSAFAACVWDLIIDFGLGKQKIRNYLGIRVVTTLCVFNLILRMVCVPKTQINLDYILVEGLEIIRRSVWVSFRISNYLFDQH